MNREKPLTPKQSRIVELAGLGYTDKEIARELSIAEGTLRTYWDRLRHRYSARSRTEVVAIAMAGAEPLAMGRMLIDKLPMFVWTARSDGYVDYVNDWFVTEGGVDKGECLGPGCRVLMPKREVLESKTRWEIANETGSSYDALVHFVCDGEPRLHKIRLTPLVLSEDGVDKWLGYGRELAERADHQLLRFLKTFLS